MSQLTIYDENDAENGRHYTDGDSIIEQLSKIGVQFECWQADKAFAEDADNDTVLAAYDASIGQLKQQYSFQSVDVIGLKPDHPEKAKLRQKFLAEHTHDDFEIRFFVEGSGLFYLHVSGKVYAVLCEQGDLISVPAGATHWFDMGENPDFRCIRFFTTEEGWEADFTGSEIAARFPSYDQYVAEQA